MPAFERIDSAYNRSAKSISIISERAIDESRPLKVIYIGAGVSGIVGAIEFSKYVPSIELVIYEKNPEVGGTWYENRYPGCACDVPSLSYQLSSESSTDWSQFYASAPEILQYWKSIAAKHNVRDLVKFSHKCLDARWDERRSKWIVRLARLEGENGTTVIEDECDVFITGTGTLNEWKWPDIKGLHDYKGTLLHSANWDETFDASDKAVAVIGGGSSGIQIVPALANKVTRMDHYVRGKTWICNQFGDTYIKERGEAAVNGNFSYTAEEKDEWRKDPAKYIKLRKNLEMVIQGLYGTSERDNPAFADLPAQLELEMRRRLQGKPEIADKLIPQFPPLCKRLTPGPGYLEALASPKVDAISTAISHIDTTGIVTSDGRHRAVDAIVCATGFNTDVSTGFPIYGRDNVNLRTKYAEYPRTYLGLCTDGFPNFFQSLGPNSFQGAGSLLMQIEATHGYIAQVLQRMATGNIKTVTPKFACAERFSAHCDEYFKRTVYTADCLSWYKTTAPGSTGDERMRGRVTALWPGSSVHAIHALRHVRWEDYDVEYVDGNPFGWFGNGWTVADRQRDLEGLTWYLNKTEFLPANV